MSKRHRKLKRARHRRAPYDQELFDAICRIAEIHGEMCRQILEITENKAENTWPGLFVKMKTGWQQYATRKDKLESIAAKSRGMGPGHMALAWDTLMAKMMELSSPEAPRIPKFNDLLLAVVSAQARAKRLDGPP